MDLAGVHTLRLQIFYTGNNFSKFSGQYKNRKTNCTRKLNKCVNIIHTFSAHKILKLRKLVPAKLFQSPLLVAVKLVAHKVLNHLYRREEGHFQI